MGGPVSRPAADSQLSANRHTDGPGSDSGSMCRQREVLTLVKLLQGGCISGGVVNASHTHARERLIGGGHDPTAPQQQRQAVSDNLPPRATHSSPVISWHAAPISRTQYGSDLPTASPRRTNQTSIPAYRVPSPKLQLPSSVPSLHQTPRSVFQRSPWRLVSLKCIP